MKSTSQETSKQSPKTQVLRPIRRLGQSVKVAVQILLFLIVIISANYLSCSHHQRIDLTENQDFTLSDLTKKLLKSKAVQASVKSPIKIIAVIRRSSPHYTRMHNLLDEYQRLAKGAIVLEFVDPARQTDRTLEITNTYKQPYIEDMIIVDGRAGRSKAAEPTQSSSKKVANSKSGLKAQDEEQAKQLRELSAHVHTVLVKDLYIEEVDQYKQRHITSWQAEDVISSSILRAVEGKARKIYFATDKTNLDATDGNPPWRVLARLLWQQNIELAPLRLADIDAIPSDAEGIAFIGPQYDLDDRELKIVKDYWNLPQSSIFVTLDPSVKLNNLHIFLRNYGITPRNDRVITVQSKQTLSNVRALFTRGPTVNLDLGGKSTVFDGATCSLEVREDDDQLTNRFIIPLALIKAADGWWGETRYTEEHPVFNREEDTIGNVYIAAGVVRGKATSDKTKNLISKMIVIGNTDFLRSNNLRSEQVDFVKSSVNWLMGREELIGVGPHQIHRHKITLLDAHNTFINKVLLIFCPTLAILISLIVWNTRRS